MRKGKNKVNNRGSRFLAVMTAAVTMAALTLAPAAAFAETTQIEKEETVYVVTDSTGAQDEVIVSDHLKNDIELDKIEDQSNLKDIENVKGDETFDQGAGSFITWNAGGKDIYYQGTTTRELPVTMDVKYTLDGKTVGGKDLDGASGDLTIKIKYTNHTSYNGTKVPFLVMSGFLVQDDCMKDITIDNGRVIDDGDKKMVVGLAAPGLAEDLGISSEDISLSDTVTIKGKADNFSVGDIMTIVTSSLFEDLDTGKFDDLNFDDEIDALNKGSKQLVSGSKLLYDGIHQMEGKMPDLEDGVQALKKGADKLDKGTQKARDGANALNGGIAQLSMELPATMTTLASTLGTMETGVSTLVTKLESIKAALDQYQGALNDAKSPQQNVIAYLESLKGVYGGLSDKERAKIESKLGSNYLDKLNSAIGDAKTVYGTLDQVANGTGESNPGLAGLSAGLGSKDDPDKIIGGLNKIDLGLKSVIDTVGSKAEELNQGLGELSQGAQDLASGEEDLATGAKQLANGMESLQSESGQLVTGVDKLDSGSLKVSQGMSKLYKEGIKKIVDLYNGDLKGLTSGLDSMMDASKDYKTFTVLPTNMKGSTKFIYKTPITE